MALDRCLQNKTLLNLTDGYETRLLYRHLLKQHGTKLNWKSIITLYRCIQTPSLVNFTNVYEEQDSKLPRNCTKLYRCEVCDFLNHTGFIKSCI